MPLFKLYISLFLIIVNYTIAAGQYNVDVKANLLIDNSTEYIDVKAEAFNKKNIVFSGRYVLTTIVGDIVNEPENAIKNTYEGSLILSGNEGEIVSSTTISVNKNQKAVVLFLVYNADNKLVGKDRWSINDSDKNAPVTLKKRDLVKEREGVSIIGIVTDKTKTKHGKDFFKEFYSIYLYNQLKTEELILVEEQFAQGRNTRIEVKVGNVVVAKFFVRPSYDYVKDMAKATVNNIKKHFLRLENQKKQLQGL
ncbi:hypothetical protein SCB49_02219 [unidentified eubacterium SCB49]|nr:hypothetical protein SCB49_02219 [unidentified eubacterium SCB49]